jgi:hypothetical protein
VKLHSSGKQAKTFNYLGRNKAYGRSDKAQFAENRTSIHPSAPAIAKEVGNGDADWPWLGGHRSTNQESTTILIFTAV